MKKKALNAEKSIFTERIIGNSSHFENKKIRDKKSSKAITRRKAGQFLLYHICMREDFSKTVADHMDAGFLENIIGMIKKERQLLELVPVLISDGRQRVRIGAVVLVETFLAENRSEIEALAPSISDAFENENPSVRADAVYMLSLIGGSALPYLLQAAMDSHPVVREAALEAITELKGRGN